MSGLYRCHQCFGVVPFEGIAHVDMYVDLCWLQCMTCEAAFGPQCGSDRRVNPHPHGYFACQLRQALVQPPAGPRVCNAASSSNGSVTPKARRRGRPEPGSG
jgi:hypothetical protein